MNQNQVIVNVLPLSALAFPKCCYSVFRASVQQTTASFLELSVEMFSYPAAFSRTSLDTLSLQQLRLRDVNVILVFFFFPIGIFITIKLKASVNTVSMDQITWKHCEYIYILYNHTVLRQYSLKPTPVKGKILLRIAHY